jgi:hypothetical protein
MSVLKYGMPSGDRLYCDNPVCRDYATIIVHLRGEQARKEIFACDAHMTQLASNQSIRRLEKLKEPGQRNTEKV